MVVAGQKQQCVARRAKLAVALNGVNLVDLALNVRCRHGWIEDQYIGAEIGLGRAPGKERSCATG